MQGKRLGHPESAWPAPREREGPLGVLSRGAGEGSCYLSAAQARWMRRQASVSASVEVA